MKRLLILMCCGLFVMAFTACDDESSGDTPVPPPPPQADGEVPEFHEEVDARRKDEFGVPSEAEPELVRAFNATLEERTLETGNRFDIDRGPFQENLNAEILADFEGVEMRGGAHNRRTREDLAFNGLEDLSEAELIEVCEAISEYLATVPEHVTMRGPVVFVGSNYQLDETSERTNHHVITPVFYNETLAPNDPGSCTVV